MRSRILYIMPLLCLGGLAEPALAADTYCRAGHAVVVYDGANTGTDWEVTTMRGRRVQIAGNTRPSRGCSFSFRSVARIIKNEFVQRPALGRARFTSRNRLYYETDRAGSDTIAYRVTWEDWRTNKVASAIIRLHVTATDRPI